MKLYANTMAIGDSTLKIESLTKKLPVGENVYTVYVDDEVTSAERRSQAGQYLGKLTGKIILDQYCHCVSLDSTAEDT